MSTIRSSRKHRRRLELAAAGLFVLANLAVPLFVEDFFPFTTTPMFRDKPRFYSNYVVYEIRDGQALPLKGEDLSRTRAALALQRTYDGNPHGLGVGQAPPPTLDRFSDTLEDQPDEGEVRRHVSARLATLPDVAAVEVVQEVFGPREDGSVGLVRTRRWRVARPAEGR